MATSLDERPWVGVVEADTQGGTQTHDRFSFQGVTIIIRNSGKTPALKVSGRISELSHLWIDQVGDFDSETRALQEQRKTFEEQLERQHPPPPGWKAEREAMEASMEKALFPEGGVLAPGAVSEWHVGAGSFGRRTNDGSPMTLYILGKITYYDILGGPQHTTKFCLMHLQGDSFTNCFTGNSME
ncbi:MAG: hypothetical protein LAO04_04700 [Acidobacteriia bacterium]|nr:hypothetical protein [Terriglobia bacterium]